MMSNKTLLFSLLKLMLFAAVIVILPAGLAQAAQEAGPATSSIAKLKILFKVDPSITRGMYMGDRWMSPPHYAFQEGKEVAVEAAVQGLDAQGKQVNLSPVWKADDPAMIKISPDTGQKVTLTIIKEGKSKLRVSFGEISRELHVKAWHKDKAMHVEITE